MHGEWVVARLRRLISDVDLVISDLTDEEAFTHLEDARVQMVVRRVSGFDGLVIGTDQTDPATFGINPEPTLEQGEILAMKAAQDILEAEFRGKILRGELGASWQSGLEAESTITASRVYADGIFRIYRALEELLLIKFSPTAGVRSQ